MEPLPPKVLNWLHRVLQAQYADVNRTYSDSAQILTQHKSLRPSTEVYTFEDGRSALLLRLAGTLPVNFRGAVYSIPISVWLPYEYPRAAPIVLVNPSTGMMVRPGQHISGEGRVYHPYLAGWRPDTSNIVALSGVLQDVFSHEPPVIATQHPQPQQHAPREQNGAPPVPPLPPDLNRSGSLRDGRQSQSPAQAPAPPPKPLQERQNTGQSDPPPLPPLPSGYGDGSRQHAASPQSGLPSRSSSLNYSPRYSQPPPLPQRGGGHRSHSVYSYQQQPVAPHRTTSPPQLPQPPPNQQQYPPQGTYTSQQPGPPVQPWPYPPQQYPHHPNQAPPHQQPQQHPSQFTHSHPHKPQPPPDLLSDPFDQPLPRHSEPLPAPPIPPNPEKDALLHTLSRTLTTRIHDALNTNASAAHSLQIQQQSMHTALQNLQAEQQALSTLSSQVSSNAELLQQAMRDADGCIARAGTASVPSLDEVLVAPTVVGQQLYELVAEVQACAGAREVLGRALDRGRIGAESWVRAVRGLAREEFLKRVLVEKAAKGLGLREVQAVGGQDGGWI